MCVLLGAGMFASDPLPPLHVFCFSSIFLFAIFQVERGQTSPGNSSSLFTESCPRAGFAPTPSSLPTAPRWALQKTFPLTFRTEQRYKNKQPTPPSRKNPPPHLHHQLHPKLPHPFPPLPPHPEHPRGPTSPCSERLQLTEGQESNQRVCKEMTKGSGAPSPSHPLLHRKWKTPVLRISWGAGRAPESR